MGMKPGNEAGGGDALRPVAGYLTKQLTLMPELQAKHMPEYDVKEYDPVIDSSEMEPTDWANIAEDISSNYYEYDGFVVIMGTDTMAYCASALSFMMENLGKPVVLTGSMIPFAVVYNDARRNLIVSLLIASNFDIPEVCIFFNNKLLRGNRSCKLNSMSLDAFDSPNYPPLATLGVGLKLGNADILQHPKGRLRVHTYMDSKIMVLRLVPGIQAQAIRSLISGGGDQPLKALVIELFGNGNSPSRRGEFMDALKAAIDAGILVVACSQCPSGRVMLNKYAIARRLQSIGVLSAHDCTVEAATTKLMYLFGRGVTRDEAAFYMNQSLRGEMTMGQYYDDIITSPDTVLLGSKL